MSVLPSSFASLRNLLELSLGCNAFEQFPEVICELRSLRKLWLNGNKLSSLPQSFANLRELRELYIFEQLLQGVSSSGVRAAESGESHHVGQPIERAASGHHQACWFEIPEFEWKLVHQLSSVCWRFASAFSLLLIRLVQSARFHFSVSCSQLVQAILFRVLKVASQIPIAPLPPTASRDCSTVCHHWRRLLLRGVERVDSISGSRTVRSSTVHLHFRLCL
ncbi:MAG: leucine-rich repeat domain-containing protein [Saprospiraceae bacterium]|nr:leucine-rich repeat domain-containing protein [Candidatus Vicinibacter affinis]